MEPLIPSSISGLRERDSKPPLPLIFHYLKRLPTTLLFTDLGLLGHFMLCVSQTKSFFFILKFKNLRIKHYIFKISSKFLIINLKL